ncbi:VIN3-like protein 1 isoform X2 [Aristolochia californica]|uniref:VIN3-like protein 1 isoform X2 n=1 Tax=Aristolochia californica TaxID=171875 RepID=UPI0035E0016A
MEQDDTVLAKVLQALSSIPEKNGHVKDLPNGQEIGQSFLKPKKEIVWTSLEKERKHYVSSKTKLTEHLLKATTKGCKSQESRKPSGLTNQARPKKQHRKAENPVRLPSSPEISVDDGSSNSLICKNSACRAFLTPDDTFCKRCSCCICHLFDDNKDPSLWLVCTSESGGIDSCGLSCHIECSLLRRKAGVVDLGQFMQLDGSYCCASCGKVSGIIESWKKQLIIAKDARRVDVLCYRIYLSHRLLDGTSRFKELYEIVEDAKDKLEDEVGPLNGVSSKMGRGIVSRLSVASDIQELCSLAIEKADAWLSTSVHDDQNHRDSLPAACRFQFEDVNSSSLVMVLKEIISGSTNDIKGYKLWYYKSQEEPLLHKEPICAFPRTQRRFLISNLQPCTEYTFQIISFTELGDLGHSEAKCFTKSVEIMHKITNSLDIKSKNKDLNTDGSSFRAKKEALSSISSGFKVRDLGTVIEIAWAQEEGCLDEFYSCDADDSSGGIQVKPEVVEAERPRSVSRQLDLNVTTVPDLNAEVTLPLESSGDEGDNGCSSERIIVAEEDRNYGGGEKNGEVRSNGSGDSTRQIGEVPAVESRTQLCMKQTPGVKDEACDGDSTLINWPALFMGGPNRLDGNYEHCVKTIRWLERGAHIDKEFRERFFTWFSLRATEQERRVVNTFIRTLEDDPSSLADQLLDSFEEIISSKRPRNGFCSKLWH